ncbi:MAG: UpxY family transcription antiterminator [Bacteroidales bacterium]|nr:UpxY family transcription antiterminator [Bacteroidales bacterium]MDY0216724.1 UpxY family transcription antiterminator [Bacteroidales bacterium]
MADSNPKWYVFYCRSRSEKKVLEMLTREGYSVCLPLVKELRQWSDRKKKVIVPLIPGYAFIYCKLHEIYSITLLPNIVTVVRIGKEYAILRQEEIDLLNKIIENDISASTQPISVKKGEKVRVINGVLTGQVGVCYYDSENKYITIAIESIGKELKIKILSEDVEVIKETTMV